MIENKTPCKGWAILIWFISLVMYFLLPVYEGHKLDDPLILAVLGMALSLPAYVIFEWLENLNGVLERKDAQ